MSDNVEVTAGTGTPIRTDDVGGIQYQVVKLDIGGNGVSAPVDGNSGTKSTGTVRVVLATDQPQLTNKLLTTPDLPSGASTAAKQPALGTAGTASADVISVQGIASMTPLLTSTVLTTGSAAIGKLAANSGVDIGDVDITSIAAGTNVIGKVRVVDSAGDECTDATANAIKVLNVDAAGDPISSTVDRLTDNIGVAAQTDVIMNDVTALTPKFYYEALAASDTDEEIIALVSAKKIRIVAAIIQCGDTATDVTFKSNASTTIFKCTNGANGGMVLPYNPVGYFQTVAGEPLTATSGSGSTTQITLTYIEV